MDAYLADNLKSRILRKDGTYVRSWQAEGKRKPPVGSAAFSSQDFLLGLAEGKQAMETMPAPTSERRGGRAQQGTVNRNDHLFSASRQCRRAGEQIPRRTKSALSTKPEWSNAAMSGALSPPWMFRLTSFFQPIEEGRANRFTGGKRMGHEGKLQFEDGLRPTASFADFRKMLDKYSATIRSWWWATIRA